MIPGNCIIGYDTTAEVFGRRGVRRASANSNAKHAATRLNMVNTAIGFVIDGIAGDNIIIYPHHHDAIGFGSSTAEVIHHVIDDGIMVIFPGIIAV
jgi:hypothetical protein